MRGEAGLRSALVPHQLAAFEGLTEDQILHHTGEWALRLAKRP